jgi:hypothetical protein
MKKNSFLAAAIVVSTVALSGANAFGSSASSIESDPSGTLVTYDNASGAYPVVSAILSQPGTLDGYTYTKYVFLAADSTGSLDIFGLPSGSTYVPTLGDGLSISGTYSPFDAIPEIGTTTSVIQESTGNAVSSPFVTTIPSIEASLPNLSSSVGEYLVQIDNVTISNPSSVPLTAGQDFLTHANTTLEITDGSNDTMELFQYASSYSAAGTFGGTLIPTGTVDVTGIVDVFGGANEFIPIAITPVPEPATLSLCGGVAMLAFLFRLRKKA